MFQLTEETREWLTLLGDTPQEQYMFIKYLLMHANEDGMSIEDRAECQAAMAYLEQAHGCL